MIQIDATITQKDNDGDDKVTAGGDGDAKGDGISTQNLVRNKISDGKSDGKKQRLG